MREIGKTKMASFLVLLSCCALAALAFQMYRARAEDREAVPSAEESTARIETTERSTPATGGADEAPDGLPIRLTCRLEHVQLATGYHKNRS